MAGGGPPQSQQGQEGQQGQQYNGADMNASFVDTSLMGVAISLPIIATAATALRFYARRLKRGTNSRADDWTLVITLILCWGHSINTIVAAGIGGINTITIPPREYANVALRTLWISSFFLISALYTIKVSILLFYYHIFSIKTWFRKAVIAMIVILTLWWLSAIILAFCSTDPIEAAWKDAARAHHRFDFNTWYVCYSGLSILFDVIILCFPIPMIRSLRVNTKQKISILGIFWLGGFVCVSAIIRFVFLYNSIYRLTDFGTNMYRAITVAFIWAEVEPNCSVIAACLPTYGPLFKEGQFVPRVFSSFKSKLGFSSKGTGTDLAPTNSKSTGYYELDKTTSSKGTGEIVSQASTKKGGILSTTTTDIESQRDLDRDFYP